MVVRGAYDAVKFANQRILVIWRERSFEVRNVVFDPMQRLVEFTLALTQDVVVDFGDVRAYHKRGRPRLCAGIP